MKINYKPFKHMTENQQESSIRFSPLVIKDDVFEELWYPVSCRDKMQNLPMLLVQPYITPECCRFQFKDVDLIKYQGDRQYLLVSFEHKDEYDCFLDKLELLNDLEEKCNFSISEVIYSNRNKRKDSPLTHEIILSIDLDWVKSPLYLSLFTFLCRCLSYSFLQETDWDLRLREMHDIWNENVSIDYDVTGDEGIFTSAFVNKTLNLEVLLSERDRILGDDPLTGLNDKAIIGAIGVLANTYGGVEMYKNIYSDCECKFESKHFKPITLPSKYSFEAEHSLSGFLGLYNRIGNFNWDAKHISLHLFPKWTINYLELMIDKGLISKSRFHSMLK